MSNIVMPAALSSLVDSQEYENTSCVRMNEWYVNTNSSTSVVSIAIREQYYVSAQVLMVFLLNVGAACGPEVTLFCCLCGM